MRRADDAVAGFFEDLPVLLFVLVGVTVLVVSATWVTRERAARDLEVELDGIARDITRELLGSVVSQFGASTRMSSLTGMDILSVVTGEARGRSFCVTVSCLHPDVAVVIAETSGEPSTALCTGFARSLFNALDDRGLVSILEVRTIVW